MLRDILYITLMREWGSAILYCGWQYHLFGMVKTSIEGMVFYILNKLMYL